MSEVTVQAMQPVLGLDYGAVATIERTRRVDAAIGQGRLRVIAEPATGGDADAVEAAPQEPEEVADDEQAQDRDEVGVSPNRNAAKSVWSQFLREHDIDHDYDALTRDQLVELWDEHSGSRLAGPED